MVQCFIKNCKNNTRKQTKKNCGVTFHRFPKDEKSRKLWIAALKQTHNEPNIWSKICSKHFSDACKYETKKGMCKLADDAIPTLHLDDVQGDGHDSKQADAHNASHTKGTLSSKDKEILRLEQIAKRRRMKCNALYAAQRRLKKKVQNISLILSTLKENKMINQEQAHVLEVCGVSAGALFKRMMNKDREYTPELRTFASTLHFYSPKAYSYVRSTFNTCLPHPSTMRKWRQHVDAKPGSVEFEAAYCEAFEVEPPEQKIKVSATKEIDSNLVKDAAKDEIDSNLVKDATKDEIDSNLVKDAAKDEIDSNLVKNSAKDEIDSNLVKDETK